MSKNAGARSQSVICPACGLADTVAKVSTIHLIGIDAKRQPAGQETSQTGPLPPGLTTQELHTLSRKLAPPSSGKGAPNRPVHPDIVVLVFSAVVPFFLVGILNQQSGLLIPILILLAASYGLYFYKRKAAIAKHEQALAARQNEQERIQQGIHTWMKLYYCLQDEIVFLPGKKDLVPVDEMMPYLLKTNKP